jgi:Sec-independent protein translocase protein TatA
MDIFGIGTAEILVIVLLTLIVAGPKRSVEWARQAGVWIGQLRDLWQRMMEDLRNEVGDDADEILRTADEFRQTATDFRQQTSVRNLAGRALNMAESSKPKRTKPTASNAAANGSASNDTSRYNAWTKPTTPSEDDTTAPDNAPSDD